MALAEIHQFNAASQSCKQQHFHFQGCSPDIHRTINHEGAVRDEQHRGALKAGVKNEVEEQMQTALNLLTASEFGIATALYIDPAKNRPPEAGINGGDASDGSLAVIGHQFVVLFHKAGGKDPTGLNTGALQIQADREELPDDGVSTLKQQVDHHGNVVPQEDLAVIQCFFVVGMFQGSNAAGQFSLNVDQRSLEVLLGFLHHVLFF